MTQFSGFAPNYYFGQHNKGLSIYMSPGFIDGIPFNGQVPSVSPQSITTLWVNSDGTLSNTNNLLVSPNDFTNAAWVFAPIASLIQESNQSDPTQGKSASLINLNSGSVSQQITISNALIGLPFTFSMWVQNVSIPNSLLFMQISNGAGGGQNRQNFSISSSWQLIQITGVMSGTAGINNVITMVFSAAGQPGNILVYATQLVLGSTLNINSNPYPFGIVISGTIDTGGNITNPNILDDGITSITDIRIR